jgi:hypothetical protein
MSRSRDMTTKVSPTATAGGGLMPSFWGLSSPNAPTNIIIVLYIRAHAAAAASKKKNVDFHGPPSQKLVGRKSGSRSPIEAL